MVYPIVTPVPWALGRYDSYTLYPDGTLVGTIHPPGLAFQQIDNQHLSDMDNLFFLSGSWFVCASLPRPYKYMSKDANFLCELILLIGVKSKTYTLHTPEIHFYYYSLRKYLLPRAITKAFNECSSSSGFISRIFDMTIQSAPHKKMHIRYLNQIYGQTYPSWKVIQSSSDSIREALLPMQTGT
jgi:hypothetical protein